MIYNKTEMEVGNSAMVMMGVGQLTYIRPAREEDGYAVCAADGTELAIFPNYQQAYYTARQFHLDPVNVH
jgi:hypothetical protein